MRIFGKILLYVLGLIIVAAITLSLILWIKSPNKADPIVDVNGYVLPKSISRIEKINLGGLEQYVIIRGADSTKPVMLYLHGGPGNPEIVFMKETNTAIENDFVMVYWEQAGAGKSYSSDIPAAHMTIEQFISDTRELTEILSKRFNQDKIYLMGHSWGSLLGILSANKHPELYKAYFGIGQVCDQYRGERVSFDWVKEQAAIQGDENAIDALSKTEFPDSLADSKVWMKYLMFERSYVNRFGGGITHEMKEMGPVVKMLLNAKEYSFRDKFKYMGGSLFSLENLWQEVIHRNLFNEIDSLQVPVYIFQGKYDYQTPTVVAKEFFDQLKAPQKEFFYFENSAHSPNMEEVEKFNAIVKEKAVL